MITVTHLDHYYYPLHTDMAKLIVGFCNFPLITHQKGKVFKGYFCVQVRRKLGLKNYLETTPVVQRLALATSNGP